MMCDSNSADKVERYSLQEKIEREGLFSNTMFSKNKFLDQLHSNVGLDNWSLSSQFGNILNSSEIQSNSSLLNVSSDSQTNSNPQNNHIHILSSGYVSDYSFNSDISNCNPPVYYNSEAPDSTQDILNEPFSSFINDSTNNEPSISFEHQLSSNFSIQNLTNLKDNFQENIEQCFCDDISDIEHCELNICEDLNTVDYHWRIVPDQVQNLCSNFDELENNRPEFYDILRKEPAEEKWIDSFTGNSVAKFDMQNSSTATDILESTPTQETFQNFSDSLIEIDSDAAPIFFGDFEVLEMKENTKFSPMIEEVITLNKNDSSLNELENSLNNSLDKVENSLNNSIDKVENSLNNSLDKVENSLNNSIDKVENSLNNSLYKLDNLLNNSIDKVENSLNNSIDKVESSSMNNGSLDEVENSLMSSDSLNKMKNPLFTQNYYNIGIGENIEVSCDEDFKFASDDNLNPIKDITFENKNLTKENNKISRKQQFFYKVYGKYFTENSVQPLKIKNCDKYQCHYCSYNSRSESSFIHHMKCHKESFRFECKLCCYKTAEQTALLHHLRRHLDEKPFQCAQCDMRFVDSSALTRHFKIHTGKKPNICNICDYRCIQKFTMKSHILRYHSSLFKCQSYRSCSFSTASFQEHAKHKNTHKTNCKKRQRVKKSEKRQRVKKREKRQLRVKKIQRIFRDNDLECENTRPLFERTMRYDGKRAFKCHFCLITSVERCQLIRHMYQHIQHRYKPNYCFACDYRCVQNQSLLRHYNRYHINLEKVQCKLCKVDLKLDNILPHIKTFHKEEFRLHQLEELEALAMKCQEKKLKREKKITFDIENEKLSHHVNNSSDENTRHINKPIPNKDAKHVNNPSDKNMKHMNKSNETIELTNNRKSNKNKNYLNKSSIDNVENVNKPENVKQECLQVTVKHLNTRYNEKTQDRNKRMNEKFKHTKKRNNDKAEQSNKRKNEKIEHAKKQKCNEIQHTNKRTNKNTNHMKKRKDEKINKCINESVKKCIDEILMKIKNGKIDTSWINRCQSSNLNNTEIRNTSKSIQTTGESKKTATNKIKKCNICDFTCISTLNFNSHKRRHLLLNNNYTCTFCKQICRDSHDYKKHLCTHVNFKAFYCFACPYKTNYRGSLYSHIQKDHVNTKIVCNFCSSVYYGKEISDHISCKHLDQFKMPKIETLLEMINIQQNALLKSLKSQENSSKSSKRMQKTKNSPKHVSTSIPVQGFERKTRKSKLAIHNYKYFSKRCSCEDCK